MIKQTIKLTLAYDGSDFSGWQTQKQGERTVQNVLEQALFQVHGYKTSVQAAGRTDAGVHATAQVAHFHTDHTSLTGNRFAAALNANLPPDVRILKSEETAANFHARHSARWRLYRYYLYQAPVGLPHYRKYCVRIRKSLNINTLNALARTVVGVHDFTSFSSLHDKSKSKEREVFSSCFYTHGPFIVYEIKANSFLWKMVRTIIGTIIELALQEKDPCLMKDILKAKDRKAAGHTAAARGLFLEGVNYG
jgi:tRNA pseudouridine38-40 synthase